MSNERLRSALTSAGLTIDDLSAVVEVDPKTVERWITRGRTPHRRHRLAVAAKLGRDEAYLWPETNDDPRTTSASGAEFVTLYPNRGAIPAGTWESLIDSATESIDLLAFAGSFLHDSISDFTERIAARARADVQVRLLFGDPDSEAVRLRGEEEGIGDLLASRCRLSWAYFRPVTDHPGVEARAHGCALYNSIFRFDNDALVNAHSFGAAASHSPVLHLKRIEGGRLFSTYMSGFERTWEQSGAYVAG